MRPYFLGVLLLAACAKSNEYIPPPPPRVTVAPPERRDVIDYVDFTGTTTPHVTVEVRARVQGVLSKILYKPGTVVGANVDLFKIDPAEYQAEVDAATADVDRAKADKVAAAANVRIAEANLALAETGVKKLEKAYESRAVSEIRVLETRRKRDVAAAELVQATAQIAVADSKIVVAEANLAQAKLKLGYTTIKAPIEGKAAMWNVDVGGLVGSGQATLLTTIVNQDKVYCDFYVAERWALEMRKSRGPQAKAEEAIVHLGLVTDEGFPHKGYINYVAPTVDADTGTIRIRAVFDNTEGDLAGGLFARIRFPVAKREGALLVSERVLGDDQSGTFVLVVNSKGIVERRGIKPGAKHGDKIVVLEGLRQTDRVIVGGGQRARPGMKVVAEDASGS